MKRDDYTEANRKMWNATAAVHERAYVNELKTRIKSADFSTFDAVEKKLFAQLGLKDKAVAQVCCNNGRELIAIKKAGAGRCVGFDISDAFVKQAQMLATAGAVDVEFVRTNVYEISADFHNQFDIVYVSIGVFGWLPDIEQFVQVLAKLLKPNGQLFIYEMHPILDMFDGEKGLEVVRSYFDKTPDYVESEPDYMDSDAVIEEPSYWFTHKLSDIFSELIDNGLYLTHFAEYDYDISGVYKAFETLDKRPPLCYSLIAQKAKVSE